MATLRSLWRHCLHPAPVPLVVLVLLSAVAGTKKGPAAPEPPTSAATPEPGAAGRTSTPEFVGHAAAGRPAVREAEGWAEYHGEGDIATESSRAANKAVALSLLAGITFVMIMFYMVNHPDVDMKMYSWELVSGTVSIFVTVLVFHILLGALHDFDFTLEILWPQETTVVHLLSHLCLFLGCFIASHTVLALLTVRVCAERRTSEELVQPGVILGEESAAEKHCHMPEGVHAHLICWTTLLAHMTSFAAIHVGGSMQHFMLSVTGTKGHRHAGPLFTIAGIFPMVALLFSIFRAADIIRSHYVTVSEAARDLWDELAEEAEDEVASLSLSFLLCQSLRFCISGFFAGPEGRVPARVEPGPLMLFELLCVAAVSLGLRLLLMHCHSAAASTRSASVDTGLKEYIRRWIFIFGCICSQHFAWCLLYLIIWSTRATMLPFDLDAQGYGINSPAIRVILSLIVSICTFLAIWFFDCISDATADVSVEVALRSIIRSFAVLVGFSWEQAFSAGIEELAKTFETPEQLRHHEAQDHLPNYWLLLFKSTFSFVLCIIIVPAWRVYILRNVLQARQAHEEQALAKRQQLLMHVPLCETEVAARCHGDPGARTMEAVR